MIDLPLGATEDRVCGTIDIEKLCQGVKAFEPGLLAKANRGILYVDKKSICWMTIVNVLLRFHGYSGWNTVERKGISSSHLVVLVGSQLWKKKLRPSAGPIWHACQRFVPSKTGLKSRNC